MASSPTSTCSALLILLLISFSVHCYQTVAGSRSREFDYFALTLQWPGTICQSTHHCCSSNACCRGSFVPTEFTIHGLWPDYNDGTWPACCSDSDFDLKKISSLVETLEKYWPSLSCSLSSNCHGGKGSFWEHEWEKHGTCSFPVFQNEYSYFSTALQLYFKYNITKILNHAGYLPDNYHKYPLGDIVATIKKAVGALPQLVCSHGAVEELRLCFYKDFKPRDCVTVSDTKHVMHEARSSCPRFIRLPETKPLMLQSATISGLSSQPIRWV